MSQNIRADGLVAVAPRQELEGVRVGHGEHVALLHPAEAVDRRAVEVMPSSKAFSSSAGGMAKRLSWPRTSVNHRRTSRTPRSSTVRST